MVTCLCRAQDENSKIRKFLLRFDTNDNASVAKGFKLADEHPRDFVALLDDPGEEVQLRAQLFIRLSADSESLKALHASKSGRKVRRGPIPVPLARWDYEEIEKYCLCPTCQSDSAYLYALVLDGSDRATSVLSRYLERFPQEPVYNIHPNLFLKRDIESALIKGAFYLPKETRRTAKVRRIAMTKNGKKALFEVADNEWPNASEWFYVVVFREAKGWRMVSVFLAGQS